MSAATSALPGRERLSVTTGIIGIVTLPVMEKIADLNVPSTSHTPVLNQALLEIKQCRATVHLLYKTFSLFEAGRLPYPERAGWISVDDLITLLTDAVLSLSDVQAICEQLDIQRRSGVEIDADTSTSIDQKTSALCSRIRWLSLSINIMNTILNCSGEADAESARVALNRRMARLLSSNSAISSRMRLFSDAYHNRLTQQRNNLPHYTPPEAQPLPSPASESLVSGGQHQARARSPYSGYTLADVPVMSIVALPLLTGELHDGDEYYTAAYARRAGRDLGNMICLAEDKSGLLGVIRSRPSAENGGSETGTDSSNGATTANPPATSNTSKFGRIVRVKRRWRWRT